MKNLFLTLALFGTLLSLGAGFPLSCPTAESLYPCTCRRMAYGLHVVCANFEDIEALIRALKVLRDYRVQNVLLHGLELKEVLPRDLFDGLEINELRVEKSNLKFSQPAFKGLDDSLHILNVEQHSIIKSSEDFALARLNNLTELNIRANPLKEVRNEWLNGKIPNVKSIRLEEDNIRVIQKEAFASLPRLEYISIAENRLQVVERSMFPTPANFLRVIDLSGNEISSLPMDIFHQMPSLKEVILSGNDLETLPKMVWKPVWQDLEKVLLKGNKLRCDEELDWLKELRWPRQVIAECLFPTERKHKTLKDVYKT